MPIEQLWESIIQVAGEIHVHVVVGGLERDAGDGLAAKQCVAWPHDQRLHMLGSFGDWVKVTGNVSTKGPSQNAHLSTLRMAERWKRSLFAQPSQKKHQAKKRQRCKRQLLAAVDVCSARDSHYGSADLPVVLILSGAKDTSKVLVFVTPTQLTHPWSAHL